MRYQFSRLFTRKHSSSSATLCTSAVRYVALPPFCARMKPTLGESAATGLAPDKRSAVNPRRKILVRLCMMFPFLVPGRSISIIQAAVVDISPCWDSPASRRTRSIFKTGRDKKSSPILFNCWVSQRASRVITGRSIAACRADCVRGGVGRCRFFSVQSKQTSAALPG